MNFQQTFVPQESLRSVLGRLEGWAAYFPLLTAFSIKEAAILFDLRVETCDSTRELTESQEECWFPSSVLSQGSDVIFCCLWIVEHSCKPTGPEVVEDTAFSLLFPEGILGLTDFTRVVPLHNKSSGLLDAKLDVTYVLRLHFGTSSWHLRPFLRVLRGW